MSTNGRRRELTGTSNHGSAATVMPPGHWSRAGTASARGGGLGAEYYSEATLLEKFRASAPTYLERLPATDWEWLFLMQHYGLRTRLLDWTESSLIALYFAIRDNSGDVDAAVWAMNPWWLNRQTFGEYALFPADDPRAKEHAPLRPEQELKGKLPLRLRPFTPASESPRSVACSPFTATNGLPWIGWHAEKGKTAPVCGGW